jgi:hypothetical protein
MGDACIGLLLTGCLPTNVGDRIPNTSHFLDRKRADAVVVPQVISYLRIVVFVMMGVIIVDGNAIKISGTKPLEYNVFKYTLGKGTTTGQTIRNQGTGGGRSHLYVTRENELAEHFVSVFLYVLIRAFCEFRPSTKLGVFLLETAKIIHVLLQNRYLLG